MSEFNWTGDVLEFGKLMEFASLLRKHAELQKTGTSPKKIKQSERKIREQSDFVIELIQTKGRRFTEARLSIDQADPKQLKKFPQIYREWLNDIPTDVDDPVFGVWRRHLEKVILTIEQFLAEEDSVDDGVVELSEVEQVVAQAASAAKLRAEIILGLKQTGEELKQKYPNETWPDIDREIRKAIDKVRREA